MKRKSFSFGRFLYDNTTAFMMLGIFAFFSVFAEGFLSIGNITTVLSSSSVLLLVSIGMCFVVISGGTDLSVAAAYGMGGLVCVYAIRSGIPAEAGILLALAAGLVFGLINSFLILKVGISVWLATLGTLFIGESIERIVTKGGTPVYLSGVDGVFKSIGQGTVVNIVQEGANITIKSSIVLALIIAVAAAFILKKTVLGRHLYAAGLQRRAAELSGVSVGKCVTIAFVVSGACCCLAGVIGGAQLSSYIPVNGRYYLLDAIGTVFIGSTMHRRGFANVGGTIVGVIFFGFLTNGLNLIGVQFYWQYVIRGGLILFVLAVNAYQRNVWALRTRRHQ